MNWWCFFSLKDCNVQKIVQFNRLLEVKKLVLKSSAGCQINEVQYFLDLSANKAEKWSKICENNYQLKNLYFHPVTENIARLDNLHLMGIVLFWRKKYLSKLEKNIYLLTIFFRQIEKCWPLSRRQKLIMEKNAFWK